MYLLLANRRILTLISILSLWFQLSSPGFSQSLVKAVNPNENVFLARTKQFNEFLSRFNYKTNFNGDPIDSIFKSGFPREKIINSLFDQKDPRITPSGNNYSKIFVNEKSDFVNDVVKNNLLIYRYSDNIIAEAKSRILMNGSPKTISIFLTQEIVGKDMVKWVISSVKGDLFNFLKTDTSYTRFIPPSSNETDFMNLKRALEDKEYLQYYSSKNYVPDYLTLFYYMINSGSIRFEYVEEVVYHIIDIPGWCIKVKDINRNEMNSGWLITDIVRNSLDREGYLKSLN